jgi:acyl carrier protein
MPDLAPTIDELKRLIVDSLHLEDVRPEDIDADAPLFGAGLGLDSVDALELVVALEKRFGIRTESQEIGREAFRSVRALAEHVQSRSAGKRRGGEGAVHG